MGNQIQVKDGHIEHLIYAVAVIQFCVIIIVGLGRYIFKRTENDITRLYEFHNSQQDKCSEHSQRTAKLESKIGE